MLKPIYTFISHSPHPLHKSVFGHYLILEIIYTEMEKSVIDQPSSKPI